MSRRVVILAFGVLVLLGVRGWLAVASRGGGDDVGSPVLVLEQARIQTIELVRGDKRLRLERRESGWVLGGDQGGVAASAKRVEALVVRLCGWRRERRASSSATQHEEFGVDPVAARRIRFLAGKDHTGNEPLLGEVWVGKITGVAADLLREQNDQIDTNTMGVFVRSRSQQTSGATLDPATWVVNDFVGDLVDPSPARWIVRPLVSGRPEEVTRVAVEAPGERYALSLTPRVQFEGDPRPLDPILARSAVGSLFLLQGIGPGPAAAPPSAIRIEIQRGAQSESLQLWSLGERWFLARPGLVPGAPLGGVEVRAPDAKRAAKLGSSSELLRERALVVPLERATRVHWRSEGVERSLVRQSGTWTSVVTGERVPLRTGTIPSAKVVPLLQALASVKTLVWEPGGLPPDQHLDEWVFRGAWGRLVVVLGASREGRRPLVSSDQPGQVAWVSQAEFAGFQAALVKLLR